MRKLLFPLFLISLPMAQAEQPLRLVQTFALPAAVHGHFDHFGVDLANHRLFATPEDYKAVLVLDIETGQLLHTINGIQKPHAVLYRPDLDRIYVTDGVAGDLKTFDGKTYQLLNKVPLLKDADSIGLDISTNYLYVDNGGGDVGQKFSLLSTVDTTAGKKIGDLKIDGDTLEAVALDAYRPRLYVNDKAKNQIIVVDRWKQQIIASWPVTKGQTNVALALDEPHQRLFAACRSGQIVVFDSNTGQELQSLTITKGVDDLTYDPNSKRLYAAGDGAVTVYQQDDADHYTPLGDVPTGPLGRTARLVPEINRFFVAVPAHDSNPASVLVFEPVGVTPSAPRHDAFAYAVHAPRAEALVRATLSAHPALRKMGLHAVAPGQTDSVIIANGNATRIGIKTSESDFQAVQSGTTYCKKIENGSFYNMKMPMFDASARRIGILVMEIPDTAAQTDAEAIQMAETIRSEVEKQIPNRDWLFSTD